MQVQSPRPSVDDRGASKLWRSRSLPANSRDSLPPSPSMIPRASSLRGGAMQLSSSSSSKGLFSAKKSTKPSALWERRKKVNPALNLGAFHSETSSSSKPLSPYEVLEISPLASQDDIKTAYRRLAHIHHPDKARPQHTEAATARFLEIQSAYSTLKDPIARARIDLQLSVRSFQSPGYQFSYQSTPSTSYRYSPRAHATPSHSPLSPKAAPSSSPNYYTPRSSYSNYWTPRSPFSIGRNWETDQFV